MTAAHAQGHLNLRVILCVICACTSRAIIACLYSYPDAFASPGTSSQRSLPVTCTRHWTLKTLRFLRLEQALALLTIIKQACSHQVSLAHSCCKACQYGVW